MIHSTNAIVLNKRNYGDTSLICNLFSVDYGKFAIISKGAKSIKNLSGAALQPLNYIECIYYYKKNRNIQILKDVSIVNKFYEIEKNYNKTLIALTVIDIINHVSYVENPSKTIFRLVFKTLKYINDAKIDNVNIYYMFFLIQYLIQMGYYPSVDFCFKCNKELKSAHFNYHLGQLCCRECCNTKLIVCSDSLEIMRYLIKTHINNIVSEFKFKHNKFKEIKQLLYQYMLFHIPDIKKSKTININSYG